MKRSLKYTKQPNRIDFGFLAILIGMMITSLIAIFTSFNLMSQSLSGTSVMIQQLVWYAFSFFIMGLIMFFGNDTVMKYIKLIYFILLGCLAYLLLSKYMEAFLGNGRHLPLADDINGAYAWFQFPFASFQPSEFMKIVLILICSDIIDQHNSNRSMVTYTSDIELFKKILIWAGPPLLLILLQPDTGVCLIIGITLLVMLMCSGIKKQWFLIGGGIVLAAVLIFFYLYFFQYELLTRYIQGYQLSRITAWIYPEENMLGIGNQLYTSLLSLGSAGISGFGLQPDVVAIPEAHTDFIFAAVGQSFGLIGTTCILIMCLLLDLYILRIAVNTSIMSEKYMISGVLGILVYQQIQNLGMICGLLPITGITLPLISYGGSSILSYFIVFGMIMNISSHAKKYSDFTYN